MDQALVVEAMSAVRKLKLGVTAQAPAAEATAMVLVKKYESIFLRSISYHIEFALY